MLHVGRMSLQMCSTLCAPRRPAGVVLPLLAQTILLWQVLLAVTLLKKRLTLNLVKLPCRAAATSAAN